MLVGIIEIFILVGRVQNAYQVTQDSEQLTRECCKTIMFSDDSWSQSVLKAYTYMVMFGLFESITSRDFDGGKVSKAGKK